MSLLNEGVNIKEIGGITCSVYFKQGIFAFGTTFGYCLVLDLSFNPPKLTFAQAHNKHINSIFKSPRGFSTSADDNSGRMFEYDKELVQVKILGHVCKTPIVLSRLAPKPLYLTHGCSLTSSNWNGVLTCGSANTGYCEFTYYDLTTGEKYKCSFDGSFFKAWLRRAKMRHLFTYKHTNGSHSRVVFEESEHIHSFVMEISLRGGNLYANLVESSPPQYLPTVCLKYCWFFSNGGEITKEVGVDHWVSLLLKHTRTTLTKCDSLLCHTCCSPL